MPLTKLEQESFRGLTQKLITPILPSDDRVDFLIPSLVVRKEDVVYSDVRAEALGWITILSGIASTFGTLDPAKLMDGSNPFYFPPVPSDLLIDQGIIGLQTEEMIIARTKARTERGGDDAENSVVVWALDSHARALLLENPPPVAKFLEEVKSGDKPLPPRNPISIRADSDLQVKARTGFVPPIFAFRESYTETIPAAIIPMEIIEKYDLTYEDLEGLEIDVKGVYILGGNRNGIRDLLFLGETRTPHRHIKTLGQYHRVDLDEKILKFPVWREICDALEIHPKEANPQDLRATNQQVAALFKLMVYSAKLT